jgi:hypothetical protein
MPSIPGKKQVEAYAKTVCEAAGLDSLDHGEGAYCDMVKVLVLST